MLQNINPGSFPGQPFDFVEAAGTTFFSADHAWYGRELWKTDGTTEGTVVVKDINAGLDSSNPYSLTSFNGKVYFAASDEFGRTHLWSSDGTPFGTARVNSDQEVYDPEELTVVGDTMYFVAETAGGDVGLFKITTAQPTNQIELATFGDAISDLTAFNSNLYFQGWSADKGFELWISNSTREGTRLLHDINPEAQESFPTELTPFGSFLYFTAENNNEGRELYRTTGVLGSLPQIISKSGITGVLAGQDSSVPQDLTVFNSRLYFSADGGAGEGGRELWRTTGDGTVAERVVNLNGNDNSSPTELTVFNDVLYFAANHSNVGNELFRTRGGINDAERVTVFPTANSFPINLAVVNNRLLFAAFGGKDDELWSVPSNSATAATPVKNINPNNSSSPGKISPVQSGGVGYFSADDGTHGQELWRTDGTEAGTRLVRDTNDGIWSGIWSKMVTFGGQVFFAADDGAGGFNVELWRTDGTPAGTSLHSDLWNGDSSEPDDFTVVGSRMYFTAQTAAGRFDIFRLDSPGATPVNVTVDQAFQFRPTELAAFKNRLVFSAEDGGVERLWTTDDEGIPENTRIWANDVEAPRSMREFNGNLYFSADVGGDRKLHFLNDVSVPTVNEVMNVDDVQDGVFPVLGGNLYFVGSTAEHGRELWRHDGTFATRVSDINPNNFDAFPANEPFIDWTVFQNRLYFIANGGDGIGIELYRTNADGTGWEEVVGGGGVNKNVNRNDRSRENGFLRDSAWLFGDLPPAFAQTADGFLYFTATNGNDGFELWRTDGTAANTRMIKNINTTDLSGPSNLTAIGNRVYFAAVGENSGDELWVSDGTAAGTTLVRDIAFGEEYSHPRGGFDLRDPFAVLSAVGTSRMVFWANDDVAGFEPWMLEIDTTRPTIAISASRSTLGIGATTTVTFTLSEPSTDFTAAKVAATGGTLSNFAGSGSQYTATFTPAANFAGQGSVSVATNAFADAAGNTNATGASVAFQIDLVRPTVAISANPTTLAAGATATVTFTLSELSTDFTAAKVAATGGTLSNFAGSGAQYTATFTPAANFAGQGSVAVAAGAFADAAGNTNATGAVVNLAIDTVAPSVVSVRGPGTGTYGAGAVLEFQVQFTEPVVVVGTPHLPLTVGSASRQATFVSAASDTLVFRYVVVDGDAAASGVAVGSAVILPLGGSIRDAAGNTATISLAPPSFANVVVATAPLITAIEGLEPRNFRVGETLSVTLRLSHAVGVNAPLRRPVKSMRQSIRMLISINGQSRYMTFAPVLSGVPKSGGATSTLTFVYTVTRRDRGVLTSLDRLALGGLNRVLQDSGGRPLVTAFPNHSTDGVSFGRN